MLPNGRFRKIVVSVRAAPCPVEEKKTDISTNRFLRSNTVIAAYLLLKKTQGMAFETEVLSKQRFFVVVSQMLLWRDQFVRWYS